MTRISSVASASWAVGSEVGRLVVVDQPAGAARAVRGDEITPGAALVVLDAAGAPDVHPVVLDIGQLGCESIGSKVSIEQSSG